MNDLDEDAAERVRIARRSARQRTALLVGIALAVVATIALKWVQLKRTAEVHAAEEARPEVRAQDALLEADRAALARDPAATWVALERARAALDEGIALAPHARDLRLARLVVARRLAHVSQERGLRPDARAHLDDARDRAAALLAADRSDERARSDLLIVARELARFIDGAGSPEAAREAAQTISEAGAWVEEALVAAPSAAARALLAVTLTEAADAWSRAGDTAAAQATIERALRHAEAALPRAEDPSSALDAVFNAAKAAGEVAASLGDDALAERHERRALEALGLRAELRPGDGAVERARTALRVRLAGRAAARGDAAEADRLETEALTQRRAAVAQGAGAAARRDLARALNAVGHRASKGGRTAAAEAAYREAAEVARALPPEDHGLLLVALGNHSQVLGRLDRTREARAVAAEAYALAKRRLAEPPGGGDHPARGADPEGEAHADGARRLEDVALAGLRYARQLRAPPGADRAEARRVVAAERARLLTAHGTTSPRRQSISLGLMELSRELGSL